MTTFDSFADAQAAAGESQCVCGTYVNGVPTYWLAPRDVTEEAVHDEGFRVREGREVSDGERFAMNLVKQLRERQRA